MMEHGVKPTVFNYRDYCNLREAYEKLKLENEQLRRVRDNLIMENRILKEEKADGDE